MRQHEVCWKLTVFACALPIITLQAGRRRSQSRDTEAELTTKQGESRIEELEHENALLERVGLCAFLTFDQNLTAFP